MALAFKKGNTGLRDKVQATLEEMAADGTAAKISEKWFGKDITTIPSKSDREQKAGCCICGSPFYADNEPKCISHGFTQRKEKLLWVSADAYEAGRGYGDVLLDFRDHTAFFPATWYGHSVWTNVKKTYCSGDYKNLYFNHARHTADAAADGCLFRTVLSVRDQNFDRFTETLQW